MPLAQASIERSPSRLWQLPSWLLAQAALRGQRITARRFDVVGMRRPHGPAMPGADLDAVTLTRAGVYALGQLDAQVEDAQRELLAPLSAAERAQLTWLLTRLVEHHTAER